MVGKVGDDDHGKRFIENFRSLGVATGGWPKLVGGQNLYVRCASFLLVSNMKNVSLQTEIFWFLPKFDNVTSCVGQRNINVSGYIFLFR